MSGNDKLSAETCSIVTDLLRRKVSTIEESIVMDESHVDEMPFLQKYIDKQRQEIMQLYRTHEELSEFGCRV